MSSLRAKWHAARNPPAPLGPDVSFKNKTVLVSGANSGLGHAAAIKYAALEASSLILAVRTVEKGKRAKAEIQRQTGCSSDIFIIETVDLSIFASVKDFCDRVSARVPELHVVLLAAGMIGYSYEKSSDGYELSTQVNVLSTSLMALLLYPKVRDTALTQASSDPFLPHISHMGSIAAFEVTSDDLPPGQSLIQRLDDQSKWDMTRQYFLLKIANLYFLRGLSERAKEDGLADKMVINSSCPGLCKTNMILTKAPMAVQLYMSLEYYFVGRSAEQGARTVVGATTLGPESQGRVWQNDRLLPASEFMESKRSEKLYHETWEEMLNIFHEHVDIGEI